MMFLYATIIGLSTKDGINDVQRTSRLMGGGNVTVLFFSVSLSLHFIVSPNYYLHMLHMSFIVSCICFTSFLITHVVLFLLRLRHHAQP